LVIADERTRRIVGAKILLDIPLSDISVTVHFITRKAD
jgi:hypothetical protein